MGGTQLSQSSICIRAGNLGSDFDSAVSLVIEVKFSKLIDLYFGNILTCKMQ